MGLDRAGALSGWVLHRVVDATIDMAKSLIDEGANPEHGSFVHMVRIDRILRDADLCALELESLATVVGAAAAYHVELGERVVERAQVGALGRA